MGLSEITVSKCFAKHFWSAVILSKVQASSYVRKELRAALCAIEESNPSLETVCVISADVLELNASSLRTFCLSYVWLRIHDIGDFHQVESAPSAFNAMCRWVMRTEIKLSVWIFLQCAQYVLAKIEAPPKNSAAEKAVLSAVNVLNELCQWSGTGHYTRLWSVKEASSRYSNPKNSWVQTDKATACYQLCRAVCRICDTIHSVWIGPQYNQSMRDLVAADLLLSAPPNEDVKEYLSRKRLSFYPFQEVMKDAVFSYSEDFSSTVVVAPTRRKGKNERALNHEGREGTAVRKGLRPLRLLWREWLDLLVEDHRCQSSLVGVL